MADSVRRDGWHLARWFGPPLVVLALGLSGITFGLPWRITDRDERLVVESAAVTFSGDWRPIDVRYPMLFVYTLRAALQPLALFLSRTLPAGSDTGPLMLAELAAHPTPFYLTGRALALLAGVALVVVVAAIGRRLIGERHAWLPAMILALTPLFAEYSRYAKVDVPLAVWSMLAVLMAMRFRETGRGALAAVIFVGLAVATKWTGVLLVPIVALVAFRASWRAPSREHLRGVSRFVGFGLIITAILLASTPYILLSPAKIVRDALRVADHIQAPSGDFARPGYVLYPEALAVSSFGAGFLAAAVFGVVSLLRRRDRAWLPALLFAALYLAVVFVSQTATPRYLMPAMPVLALFSAFGIVRAAESLRRPVWLLALVAFLPTAQPLASRVIAGATNADTRLQSLALVESRVADGSAVLLAGGERGLPPLVATNAPPFWNLAWINAEERLGAARYAQARELVLRLQRSTGRPAYWVDRVAMSDLESFLTTARPAAIVLYDAESAPLPADGASDYEPPVVFRPRWFTWWKHTNSVVIRRDASARPLPSARSTANP
ncbi:MAG: ArnT family glycosyltransferase [bacterium]